MVDYAKLGNRICLTRRERNMTQECLAEKISVSVKHIGSIERAESNPSVHVLEAIARELNVTMDYLLIDDIGQKESVYIEQIEKEMRGQSDRFLRHILEYVKLLKSEKIMEKQHD